MIVLRGKVVLGPSWLLNRINFPLLCPCLFAFLTFLFWSFSSSHQRKTKQPGNTTTNHRQSQQLARSNQMFSSLIIIPNCFKKLVFPKSLVSFLSFFPLPIRSTNRRTANKATRWSARSHF